MGQDPETAKLLMDYKERFQTGCDLLGIEDYAAVLKAGFSAWVEARSFDEAWDSLGYQGADAATRYIEAIPRLYDIMRLDDEPDLNNNVGMRLARIITRDEMFAKWNVVVEKLLKLPPKVVLHYIGLMGTITNKDELRTFQMQHELELVKAGHIDPLW